MQAMQDPSFGIPTQLIQHVHLVSSHQYPYMPRMQLNQAYSFLFEAPKIVSKHATMSWQYLTAPQDGRVFLTWIAPRNQDVYPSDGYIWAGPEEHLTQEFGGYTIEVAVQYAGYRPGVDSMACHQRHRYRLIQKNPNLNANPPDKHLWIVHYSQSEPHKTIPVSQVAISRLQQAQHQARHYIEQQGQLEHREFMLHDRERWPVLKLTGRSIQAVQNAAQPPNAPPNAVAHMANPRFGGQHYQQQAQAAVGPSPAKRQRTGTAAAEHPPNQFVDVDAEEEFAFGDYFDTLSQRDVSRSRFIQHHEWMEEVFSSPYATHQIQPAYLGFGLMGELAGLTEGIFETVQDAVKIYNRQVNPDDKALSAAEISPDQLKDFEKRVDEYIEAGQAELIRLKEEHAKRLEDLRRGKTLSKAEKRLRHARWVPADGNKAVMNGLVSGNEHAEDADEIVNEVASAAERTIVAQHNLEIVQRGGLKEKVVPPPEPAPPSISRFADSQQNTMGQYPSGVVPQLPTGAGQSAAPQANAQQQFQPPATAQPQAAHGTDQSPADPNMAFDDDDDDEDMGTLDTANFDMEGMDLDIGDGGDFAFPEDALADTPGQEAQTPSAAGGAPTAAAGGSTAAAPAPAAAKQQVRPAPGSGPGLSAPSAAGQPQEAASGANPASYHATPGSNSAFDEFTGDGGLIDFDAGGADDLGMENSAFGDAFHADEGEEEGGGGAA